MDIRLSPEIILSSNSMSWSLRKRRVKKVAGHDKEVYEAYQWFNTAEKAVQSAANQLIRESEAKTFTEALVDVKNVVASLTQALTPDFDVIQKNYRIELKGLDLEAKNG